MLLSFACLLGACDSKHSGGATTRPAGVTVASLVPAATDLILAMNAGDELVAVSNYDPAEVASRKLPRVGDYQTTDWETLAALRPTVMIMEMSPVRLPAGFGGNAASLGIKLVNVRLNSLQDILDGSRRIGQEIGQPNRGAELADRLAERMDAVRRKAAGKPPVRTLLTLDERAEHLVGTGEFLNDALEAAGGVNVASSLNGSYPSADPEMLAKLKPDVVIILKPSADEGTLVKAKEFWSTLGGAPRVYLLKDQWALLPGAHVADIAEAFEACLHPSPRP
ncbi:MAG: ABC transporter substrate-binding protein [Dehalococcoidia bacterium]